MWRRRYFSALLSGALLGLALPPLPLGFLAWIALIPLMISLETMKRSHEAYLAGFLAGLVYYTIAVHWLAWNSGTVLGARLGSAAGGVLLLASSFGFLTWGYAIVLRAFGRSGHLFAPFLFCGFEMVWHLGEFAFPWPLIALTQAAYLPLVQLASVGGTALICFVVVLANATLVIGRERRWAPLIILLLAGGSVLFGTLRSAAVEERTAGKIIGRVGLIQGNIDADLKWKLGPDYSMDVYLPLTRSISSEAPDLVVWPETAAPVYLQQDWRWRHTIQEFVDSIGIDLITGARYADFIEDGRIPYNPAFHVQQNAGGGFARYSKVHLVPFGERVPFQRIIPALGKLNLGQAEFKPGEGSAVWTIRGKEVEFKVAPQICYESIFPDLGQQAVRGGADVLLNLTNDGWYDGTSELKQHLLLSRIRAVETGRSLVRATNTGISAIIHPSGRFLKLLPNGIRGGLVEDLPPSVETTFNRGGWVMGHVMLALSLMIILSAALKLLILVRPESASEKGGG